ncbi:MAG: hypothetical protein IPM34_04970 [Saprospiraceae bacterium]|nr:hypothetical protein [Saprospiraceae bacterium]
MVLREIKSQDDLQKNGLLRQIPHITQQAWFVSRITHFIQVLDLGNYNCYLPVFKSFGVWRVFIPPFMQKIEIPGDVLPDGKELINLLRLKFKCGNICLPLEVNTANQRIDSTRRINYVLPLNKTYEELSKQFHKGHKLNLKSAFKHQHQILSSRDVGHFVELYIRYSNKDIPGKYKTHANLSSLIRACMDRGHGEILMANNKAGETIAACFISHYNNRFIYHLSFANEEGKAQFAMYALLNEVIRLNAATDNILDFEGSMIPGVAYFMKGFGAEKEYYYQYIWNDNLVCRLLRLLKKIKFGLKT